MRTHPFISAAIPSTAIAVVCCVLGFQQTGSAQPKPPHEPFANSVAQQAEMIQELREINQQLKEQNALLKSGTLHVVIDIAKKK
ncbi:MAG: hypothetical protein K8U03_10260 [Planctomycetia bacterium]|nr:hypothetical protein [Planctomycetia bacterium]